LGTTYTMPNIGLRQKLNWLAAAINTSNLVCELFTAPTTLADTQVAASFTRPTFPGYATKGLFGATVVGSSTSTIATLTSGFITFTQTATAPPQTIVGSLFQLSNGAVFDLLTAGLLPNGPQVMSQVGDSVVTQLTLTDQRAPGQP